MAPELVEQIRMARRAHEPSLDAVVRAVRDFLKYNLKQSLRRAPIRWAVERMFRRRYVEVPGIHALMDGVSVDSQAGEPWDTEQSESVDRWTVSCQDDLQEPAPNFIAEFPHPDHNSLEATFRRGEVTITYYRNPTSIGELEAGMSSPFRYPQVAVVGVAGELDLMVRTEEGSGGEVWLCQLTRDGVHMNPGSFAETDLAAFLERVVQVLE